jgi:hypothetical protein
LYKEEGSMKEKILLGANADVDNGVTEDVWSEGGTYAWPTVADETSIVSSSADDAAEGTGARTVKVHGLTDEFREISEVVELDGVAPVILAEQYYRINLVEVISAGSGEANAGVIQVLHGAAVLGSIVAGDNVSKAAIFTCSSNVRNWAINKLHGQIVDAAAGVVTFNLMSRKDGEVWKSRYTYSVDGNGDSSEHVPVCGMIHFESGEDIRLTAISTVDDTQIVAGFDIIGTSAPLVMNSAGHL